MNNSTAPSPQRPAATERPPSSRRAGVSRASLLIAVTTLVLAPAAYGIWRLWYERSADSTLVSARSAVAAGDYAAATDLLETVVATRPDSRAAEHARADLPAVRFEARAQFLLREGERRQRNGEFEKAAEAYQAVVRDFRASASAPVACEREQSLQFELAARNAFSRGRELERQARYLEAVVVYAQAASEYAGTLYADRASDRAEVCQQAAPLLDAFARHRARGDLQSALEDLDDLLALGVPPAPVYVRKAKILEGICQWRRAAEAWRRADEAEPNSEAKKRILACEERAANPVQVRGLAQRRLPTGETIVSGELLNNRAEPRSDVEIEFRFHPPGSLPQEPPAVVISHVLDGVVPGCGKRRFTANVGVVPDSWTVEALVVDAGPVRQRRASGK
ncbi:MAG: hypothetical protein ACE5O2_04185 [Armatimonadota bacterium]